MIRKFTLLITALFFCSGIFSQPSLNYWDGVSYFKISGGTVIPGSGMTGQDDNNFFALNGYQFGFDFNYMIAMGFGLGLNLEATQFRFDDQAFVDFSQAEMLETRGGYGSTKFGLNALWNFPVVIVPEKFVLNLYAEGNAGLRNFSIPALDLFYDENLNKYVEVSYRARARTLGYAGYSLGFQFIFADLIGFNVSHNTVLRTKHTIPYSVRKVDAFGELYEEENRIINYLDHTGWQFGLFFIFGK
jgi:hypothetical protein